MKTPILVCTVTPLGLLAFTQPAIAEATGGYGLERALTALFFYAVAYLGVLIALIVLAVKRKGRAFGILALLSFAVIVLYPMADTMLLRYQMSAIAGAERRQPAPDLRKNSILFISFGSRCRYTVCEALLRLQDGAPLWTIPEDQARRLAFDQPIDLATVPMQQWVLDPDHNSSSLTLQSPPDTPRPEFDYLVVSNPPHFHTTADPLIKTLPQRPGGALLNGTLSITDLAAPIANNRLDMRRIEPDLLSLHTTRRARRAPLFLENTMYGNDRGWDWRRARAAWFCGPRADQTDAQYACSAVLR